MEKIKSLADLKRIKENVQTKIDLREKSEQVENLIQIKVAMATCGIAAGSKATQPSAPAAASSSCKVSLTAV